MFRSKKITQFIMIIISIIVTMAISLNLNKDFEQTNFVNGNSALLVIYVYFIYVLINKVIGINDKRLKICSILLGGLLAGFSVIGESINCYYNLSGIIDSKIILLKASLKWVGYFVILSSIISVIFNRINLYLNNKKEICLDKKSFFLKNNKKSFILCWIIIFCAWIPYFLNYFPGILTPDSIYQIEQAMGIYPVTGHHPVFHTVIVKACMSLGILIKGQNFGVAIYSVIQMLIMSACFSYVIYYMAKNKIPMWIKILSLIFFAIYPVHGMYSITMWKNILAGGAVLMFVICMTQIANNSVQFFSSKLNLLKLVIVSILVIFLINNGIYIILLTFPFIILFYRKNYKKLLAVLFTIIIINTLINNIIYSVCNIQKGSIREALSIPLQQFARVVKYREQDLSEEEKKLIYNYLPVDNLGELYNPTLSDPVKGVFNEEFFEENKIDFIKLWIKLIIKYPFECVESFLCNSYGYWYPEATNWVVSRVIMDTDTLEVVQQPIIENKLVSKMDSLVDKRNIPVVSMMFSLGFMFWVILAVFTYCIYRKKYKLIIMYIPIFVLWLTVIASPVFCEFRYLYPMVTSMPIILASIVWMKDNNSEIEQ